jgi:hypothetical protein
MPSNPPINFEEKVRLPRGNTNADYPYALKATDLMKDFVFAPSTWTNRSTPNKPAWVGTGSAG